MSIQWEKPPVQSTHTHKRAMKLAQEIASRPGEWALVATYELTDAGHASAKSRAYNIRHGRLDSYNNVGKFDATCRRTPDGWKVYVRFRGKS